MDNKKSQKKIALINDMSGYGRCSLMVQIPIISAMGVQACPVPTGIFSNHTGYDSYVKHDLTGFLDMYVDEWIKLGLVFDGICIGYLTSPEQVRIVERIINELRSKDGLVILDPVMGDDGKLYSGFVKETADAVSDLVKYADIITPNMTELCILTGSDYDRERSLDEWKTLCGELSSRGPEKVVLTGVTMNGYIGNICLDRGENGCGGVDDASSYLVKVPMVGHQRPGTGDVFSAVVAADTLNGVGLSASVEKASDFIRKCLIRSDEMGVPLQDGLCFEEFIKLT